MEPLLSAEDHELWATWWRAAGVHARTARHRRAVDRAKAVTAQALEHHPNACAMWSGGKDSTAMVALLSELGARLPTFSEKDDLDYPGELGYVQGVATQLGLDLRVIAPEVSPAAWMAKHGRELAHGADLHGRMAEMSRLCFYREVEAASALHELTFLGLRQEESKGRKANLTTRGPLYRKAIGRWVCTPLAWWTGLDVYAYLHARCIDPMPVYRCLALQHASEPWRLRKSWWVPGAHARFGGVVWLRHYFPELYRRLCSWVPTTTLDG